MRGWQQTIENDVYPDYDRDPAMFIGIFTTAGWGGGGL